MPVIDHLSRQFGGIFRFSLNTPGLQFRENSRERGPRSPASRFQGFDPPWGLGGAGKLDSGDGLGKQNGAGAALRQRTAGGPGRCAGPGHAGGRRGRLPGCEARRHVGANGAKSARSGARRRGRGRRAGHGLFGARRGGAPQTASISAGCVGFGGLRGSGKQRGGKKPHARYIRKRSGRRAFLCQIRAVLSR